MKVYIRFGSGKDVVFIKTSTLTGFLGLWLLKCDESEDTFFWKNED